MTPEERIDAALDSVLRPTGLPDCFFAAKNPETLKKMREAMRKVMSDSYIAGSNACHEAVKAIYWPSERK